MTHRGIRWRLLRWAGERRKQVEWIMVTAPPLARARLQGRLDILAELESHIESGAVDDVAPHRSDADG